MRATFLVAVLLTSCGDPPAPPVCADEGDFQITRARVLAEEADLETLTRWPDPAYTTGLASSYDRRSESPASPGWFENADFRGFVRDEVVDGRTEHVMLDLEGPGVLTRIWSATPDGTVRIYLDGSEHPVIERPFAELFDGSVSPFTGPSTYRVSNEGFDNCKPTDLAGGANSYGPVLFARSIKVTVSGVDEMYYQLSYRRYPDGTRVQADGATACLGKTRGNKEPGEVRTERRELRSGSPLAVPAPEGGGIVRRLQIVPTSTDTEELRSTVLEIAFDGETTVRAPLPEFFGSGPGLHATESVLTTIAADRLTARYPMAFRERVEVRLARADGSEASAQVELDVAPYRWDARSLYFHARWMPHRDVAAYPPTDQTLLTLEGRGVYLGNVLNVTNSSRAWWGEGDERFYLDGETFPSHFGTGTEDYYGYAWCSAVEFSRPYHGQTHVDGPETYGRISLYRWHVPDRIPFERSFRFDLEVTHWKRYARVSYEALHFWYGDPVPVEGAIDPSHYRVPPIAEHPADAADPDDIPHRW